MLFGVLFLFAFFFPLPSLRAGCLAVPTLLKAMTVMQTTGHKDHWTQAEELAVEVEIGDEHLFHTAFTCPVSRERSIYSNHHLHQKKRKKERKKEKGKINDMRRTRVFVIGVAK